MTKPLDLEQLTLYSGKHEPDGKMCIMEAVAFMADENWTDAPKCCCLELARFLRNWNDSLNDADRQMLKPFIPRLVNSVVSKKLTTKRRDLISDWYFKVNVPAFLELAGLTTYAQKGRELGSKTDWAAAGAAAWAAAWAAASDAAWDAAGAAARDAAWAAAWAAAGAAAGDAARDAAWAAAWAAAGAAAGDAAWDAATKALCPTVELLQKSALQLVNDCLEIK